MLWPPCLVVVVVVAFCLPKTTGRHNAVFKSVRQADLECRQYLNGGAAARNGSFDTEEADTCEARCELLVLRSWTDESGMVCDSYERYFRSACDDPDSRNRTRVCIERGLRATMEDVCGRAAAETRCCREQLGFLEPKSPKILRMPGVLLTSCLRQCAEMLGVSKGEFKVFRDSWFQFPDKARRLLRCLVLRIGVFSDDDGLNLDSVFLQFDKSDLGGKVSKEDFRECGDRVMANQSEDRGRRTAQILLHCIPWNNSSKSDLFDMLPKNSQQCHRALRTNCQIECSPQAIAELCHIPQAVLEKVLNTNNEGLLLPSTNLTEHSPKLPTDCVTTRLTECLADCSALGIQAICTQP